jgi:hypothetical protein
MAGSIAQRAGWARRQKVRRARVSAGLHKFWLPVDAVTLLLTAVGLDRHYDLTDPTERDAALSAFLQGELRSVTSDCSDDVVRALIRDEMRRVATRKCVP